MEKTINGKKYTFKKELFVKDVEKFMKLTNKKEETNDIEFMKGMATIFCIDVDGEKITEEYFDNLPFADFQEIVGVSTKLMDGQFLTKEKKKK